jgi:hypothetical protein
MPGIRPSVAIALALAAFLLLAGATSFARAPSRDEAWFANPAVSWLNHGHTGSTLLQDDSWVPNLRGQVRLTRIEERTYWIMPLHTVAQRVWFGVTGVGLVKMRGLSVVFGVIGLIALGFYVWRLFASPWVVAAAVSLLAIDFRWVTMSGNGRMDVMAASCGLCAYAWYVWMRPRSLPIALAGAVAAVSAGVATHPVALSSVAGLAVLVVRLDRRRLGGTTLLAGLAAGLVCLAAFGLYALQDLEAFRDQLSSNAAGRFDDLVQPWHAVVMILSLLYATSAFGGTVGLVGVLIPILLTVGVVSARLWAPERHRDGVAVLFWQLIAAVLYLMFFESQKLHFYLVHVTPLASALTGACLVWATEGRRSTKMLLVWAGAVLLALLQLAPTSVRLLRQERVRSFQPAVDAVYEAAGLSGRVLGSPEIAFAVGFDRADDDRRMRLARQSPEATLVIAEEDKVFWPWLSDEERRAIDAELAARPIVFQNPVYTVYGPRR